MFSSSPINFQLWKACHISFERSLRVAIYIPKSISSVCPSITIFKRIVWLHYYPKSLMLYINGFVSTSSTELMESFFQISYLFVSKILAENRKNIRTNSEAWILIKVQCFMYQWILFDKFYKLMEVFFLLRIRYRNIGPKPGNIRTNREAWILIKVQCFIYQWIRLDMLYIGTYEIFSSNFGISN